MRLGGLFPFVAALAAGGCFFGPRGGAGDPCEEDRDCRAGLVCDPAQRVCLAGSAATDSGGTPGPDAGGTGTSSDSGGATDAGTDASSFCGDLARAGVEECDGPDLAGFTCWTLGFAGGPLTCSTTCTFDLSGCVLPPATIAAPHDLNGDAFADFAIGAPSDDGGGVDSGAVYVFFGGPSLPAAPVATLPGSAPGDGFGVSVSTAGDLNGDGYSDLVAGAAEADSLGTNTGEVRVYFGGPGASFDDTPEAVLSEPGAVWFGGEITIADLNGDLYADLAASAPYGGGTVYAYFGGPGPAFDTLADGVIPAPVPMFTNGGDFGKSLSAGDLNDDGIGDLVVSAPQEEVGFEFDVGVVYVYYGAFAPSLESTPDMTLPGPAANDAFGDILDARADLDGDGISDLVVGSSQSDFGVSGSGGVLIYLGGAGGPSLIPFAAWSDGAASTDLFGASAAAGDLNGDALTDLVVGAPLNDAAGDSSGRAWIYLGTGAPPFDTTFDALLTGAAAAEALGYSMAYAGDIDGDGAGDLLVGTNGAAGTWAGAVHLYRGTVGGGAFDTAADAVYSGAAGGDAFGTSVGP